MRARSGWPARSATAHKSPWSTTTSPSNSTLLDEPYQGFDGETYLRFWDLVADLRTHGKAIVIITHLVFEQDRFDLLADLADGHLTPRERSGKDDHVPS